MVVMVLGAGFWVNFDGAWRVSGGGSQWFVCLFRDKASGLRCYIYILLEVCVGDFYEGFTLECRIFIIHLPYLCRFHTRTSMYKQP